jgi:integrase
MRTRGPPNTADTSENDQTGRITLASAKWRLCGIPHKRHTFGTLAVRRAEVPAVQAWMGHSDIQTTMRYVHHRDRGGEAKLLAEAFRPAGTFGDVFAETSLNVPR